MDTNTIHLLLILCKRSVPMNSICMYFQLRNVDNENTREHVVSSSTDIEYFNLDSLEGTTYFLTRVHGPHQVPAEKSTHRRICYLL